MIATKTHHLLIYFLVFISLCFPTYEWGDPSYKLTCYRGAKLVIGHDAKEETVECNSLFGMKQYCYKFVGHTGVYDVVKLGCAKMLCNPFRNTCADFELGGASGTLCCCNDVSFCNGHVGRKEFSTLIWISISSIVVYLFQLNF